MFPCTTWSWLFRTPTPCWFRVFSVFNFIWRNCTEFSCTERARQYRVCSVCFPCLILYHGTTRNFRVRRVHGDIVLIPCVFRVSFSMTELHGIFVYWSCTVIPCLFRCFPCLIFDHGTTRNFGVRRMHGDIVLIPWVFRVSFSMTELHGTFVYCMRVHTQIVFIPYVFRVAF